MDLGHCPKCGFPWPGGDRCAECGWTAIGAGLDRLPKKKKKKAKRYVEPGSWTPVLVLFFILNTGVGLYWYQPWREDWAMVRLLLGQGRVRDVRGEWEITKTVRIGPDAKLLAQNSDRGMLRFSKEHAFRVRLGSKEDRASAEGRYEIRGRDVEVKDLQRTGDSEVDFPPEVRMNLTWINRDNFIAQVGKNEMIYARRKADENSWVKMVRLGLKPDAAATNNPFRGQVTLMEELAESQ